MPASSSRRPIPGKEEDDLDDNGAAHQIADLHADDGHGRHQRIAERMPQNNPAFALPFGARRANIVFAQHIQHAGADHARQSADAGAAAIDSAGNISALQPGTKAFIRRDIASGREPAQADGDER